MQISEIIEKVIRCIQENIDVCAGVALDDSTTLVTSNLLNSFSLVSLLPVFESEFDIQFDLDELEIEDFETPAKIAEMISTLMK